MIKAVIFDMDGVIIDSSNIHYENWNSVFEKRFNITLDKKDFGMQFGRSAIHFTEYFLKKHGLDNNSQELVQEIFDNYKTLRNKITLKKGVIETLISLKKIYKIALATGANAISASEVVQKFKIKEYFDFIIGGDEVKEAKPNPEIFLRCATVFKLKPEECVVIEDASLGIQAAKKAGMFAIALEDEFTKYQNHSIADKKIKSLEELDYKLLKNMGG